MPVSAKGLLNDAQISLEKSAVDQFGTAVETFTKGGLGGVLPKDITNPPVNRNDGSWYATSYAAALAGTTNYRPKLKFLFKVEFIFTQQAKAAFPTILDGANANKFTFMIKSVDRPKVDFEYEEDVNMYNFRTKVLKKIRHRDLTVVFMDDAGNRVFDFFRALMMIHSPITRGQLDRDNSLTAPGGAKPLFGSGMAFGKGSDTAHRAVVNSNFGNSIEAIRVQQIFIDPIAGISDASQMVSFDFMNPRVVSFDLDELSHEANDVNLLTMVFDYDWMEMVKVGSIANLGASYTDKMYTAGASNVHGAPVDIMPGPGGKTTKSGGGGLLGAASNILGSVAGKGAQQLTSDVLGKAITTVAGNGRFASAIGGAISSTVSGPIGGLVQGAARERLGGIFSSVQNTVSKSTAATVVDSSTAGGDKPISVVASSDAYGALGSGSSDSIS